jgi:hypothetical protein
MNIALMDIRSREVGMLFSGEINQGENTLSLIIPREIPAGLYTVVARTSDAVATRKIHLL